MCVVTAVLVLFVMFVCSDVSWLKANSIFGFNEHRQSCRRILLCIVCGATKTSLCHWSWCYVDAVCIFPAVFHPWSRVLVAIVASGSCVLSALKWCSLAIREFTNTILLVLIFTFCLFGLILGVNTRLGWVPQIKIFGDNWSRFLFPFYHHTNSEENDMMPSKENQPPDDRIPFCLDPLTPD